MMSVYGIDCIAQNGDRNNRDFRDELQLGVKAGVNYSNVYDSKGEEFRADPKFGFAAGAFLTIPLGTYFGIQPEVLYSQKGYKATGNVLGSSYEFKHHSYFLDIPILIDLKPSEYFSILFGPQYSFLLKQKNKFSNSFLTVEQEKEFENDNIRKNILCLTGGLDINLGYFFILGLRIGWDIQHNEGDGTSTDPRYKNVWYQATLGVRF